MVAVVSPSCGCCPLGVAVAAAAAAAAAAVADAHSSPRLLRLQHPLHGFSKALLLSAAILLGQLPALRAVFFKGNKLRPLPNTAVGTILQQEAA